MFLGTGSDVGKSIITAGFCRILRRHGYSVSPFKAQNMALNSFVTMEGKEMGRAQVMQAYAAQILPHSDMNPVLLKPSGQAITQVIVQGKVMTTASAKGYYQMKDLLFTSVLESYHRLAENYNALVLEGAGSTTEMNLKKGDIVNIEMAKKVHAPVIIVADIDKGGIFASLIGTMKLLTRKEKKLVIGFIINKFRGDPSLFSDGIRFLERKTGKPVFGVLPYFTDIRLPEEDSVALQQGKKGSIKQGAAVRIAVIHLPFISNYTDFDPLEIEDSVSVTYTHEPQDIPESTVVIIPGTKNTIEDLCWLKSSGFEEAFQRHIKIGKSLIGICGGYQMLGKYIEDPHEVETNLKRAEGLGFLDIHTILEREKTLTRVQGSCRIEEINSKKSRGIPVKGYEIHMGITQRAKGIKPAFDLREENNTAAQVHEDGAVSKDQKVWGTYLHGIFENDEFRYHFLKAHGKTSEKRFAYNDYLISQYDHLADLIEKNIDVRAILATAEHYR